ncbi:MAG: T9SS type A sorting domain-containing protein [Bacteroidia bacterium]|nr:T9SS type A sorting domain-containing protein [Bacteroidia bacterium]
MKSLLLLNVTLSLLIASFNSLFAVNESTWQYMPANDMISNVEVSSISEKKVQLKWELMVDASNYILLVQKSHDGINFQTFGGLRGSSSKSYAFFDRIPEKNKRVHYRIKIVDATAKNVEYLSPSFSFIHKWDRHLLSTQSDNHWNVVIPSHIGENASLQVINSMGQVILKERVYNNFSNHVQVPTRGLLKGTYLVQVVSGENRWITRILKN